MSWKSINTAPVGERIIGAYEHYVEIGTLVYRNDYDQSFSNLLWESDNTCDYGSDFLPTAWDHIPKFP